jgi:hypothetical protein
MHIEPTNYFRLGKENSFIVDDKLTEYKHIVFFGVHIIIIIIDAFHIGHISILRKEEESTRTRR